MGPALPVLQPMAIDAQRLSGCGVNCAGLACAPAGSLLLYAASPVLMFMLTPYLWRRKSCNDCKSCLMEVQRCTYVCGGHRGAEAGCGPGALIGKSATHIYTARRYVRRVYGTGAPRAPAYGNRRTKTVRLRHQLRRAACAPAGSLLLYAASPSS